LNFGPLEVVYNTDGMTNVITTVYWEYIGTLNDTSKKIINSVVLPPPHPASFTPFDNVTEEMVTNWVIAGIGGNDTVQVMQNQLSSSIAAEILPKSGLISPPWTEN
jgi:hypothetical protein